MVDKVVEGNLNSSKIIEDIFLNAEVSPPIHVSATSFVIKNNDQIYEENLRDDCIYSMEIYEEKRDNKMESIVIDYDAFEERNLRDFY